MSCFRKAPLKRNNHGATAHVQVDLQPTLRGKLVEVPPLSEKAIFAPKGPAEGRRQIGGSVGAPVCRWNNEMRLGLHAQRIIATYAFLTSQQRRLRFELTSSFADGPFRHQKRQNGGAALLPLDFPFWFYRWRRRIKPSAAMSFPQSAQKCLASSGVGPPHPI
jgi:hypothetical protein